VLVVRDWRDSGTGRPCLPAAPEAAVFDDHANGGGSCRVAGFQIGSGCGCRLNVAGGAR